MATKSTRPEGLPRREHGSIKCVTHNKKDLILWCVDCDYPICLMCVTSTDHLGHKLKEFSNIVPEKKDNIENFIYRVEKYKLSEFQKEVQSIVAKLKDNSQRFEIVSSEILVQTKKCKDELDSLANEFLSELKTLTTDNETLLNNHKTELENRVEEMQEIIKTYRETILSGSDMEILDTSSDIKNSPPVPDTPVLQTARFCTSTSITDHLSEALGELITSVDRYLAQTHCDSEIIVDPLIERKQSPTAPSTSPDSLSTTSSQSYTLLDTPVGRSEFTAPCGISSICPTQTKEAWTCDYGSSTITLLDKEGHITQQIECGDDVSDISLSPTTHNLWLCTDDRDIMELDTSVYKLTKRFSTDDLPRSICVTNTGHVVLGTDNNVTMSN